MSAPNPFPLTSTEADLVPLVEEIALVVLQNKPRDIDAFLADYLEDRDRGVIPPPQLTPDPQIAVILSSLHGEVKESKRKDTPAPTRRNKDDPVFLPVNTLSKKDNKESDLEKQKAENVVMQNDVILKKESRKFFEIEKTFEEKSSQKPDSHGLMSAQTQNVHGANSVLKQDSHAGNAMHHPHAHQSKAAQKSSVHQSKSAQKQDIHGILSVHKQDLHEVKSAQKQSKQPEHRPPVHHPNASRNTLHGSKSVQKQNVQGSTSVHKSHVHGTTSTSAQKQSIPSGRGIGQPMEKSKAVATVSPEKAANSHEVKDCRKIVLDLVEGMNTVDDYVSRVQQALKAALRQGELDLGSMTSGESRGQGQGHPRPGQQRHQEFSSDQPDAQMQRNGMSRIFGDWPLSPRCDPDSGFWKAQCCVLAGVLSGEIGIFEAPIHAALVGWGLLAVLFLFLKMSREIGQLLN